MFSVYKKYYIHTLVHYDAGSPVGIIRWVNCGLTMNQQYSDRLSHSNNVELVLTCPVRRRKERFPTALHHHHQAGYDDGFILLMPNSLPIVTLDSCSRLTRAEADGVFFSRSSSALTFNFFSVF